MKMTPDQLRTLGYDPSQPGEVLWRVVPAPPEPDPTHLSPSNHVHIPSKSSKRLKQSRRPLLNELETEFYENIKRQYSLVFAQSIRFKLGNGIWYKPDFVVIDMGQSRVIVFEVKGKHAFRGGFENLKVAAHQYPSIEWVLTWKENGSWKEQIVLP